MTEGWTEHDRDHDREREVAKDTAQRLEREVEQTAQRLETAVTTALAAVGETARVHAEAHAKEHLAHERIHSVEAEQVKEAKTTAREQAAVLSAALDSYKKEANEWRGSLRDQEAKYLRKDEASVLFSGMERATQANADAIVLLRETVLTTFSAQSGKTEGLSLTGKVVVASATLIATLLAIVVAIVALGR